jgi:hypothetical protein
LLGLLLAACAPQASGLPASGSPTVTTAPSKEPSSTPAPTTGATSTPEKTPSAEPPGTHIPVDVPPAQLAAINTLSQELGISSDQIKVVKVESVEWPNGCLGVQKIGVMCTQQIVPGFLIILEANGKQYEFHTNRDGSQVVESAATTSSAPVKAAEQYLVDFLGVNPSDIKVASAAAVEWPDSCLGVSLPGVMCSQIVTPGLSIVLVVDGRQYEFHTNKDGSVVVGSLLESWHREGGIAGFCNDLTILATGEVQAYDCKGNGELKTGKLNDLVSAADLAKFNGWQAKFGSVNINSSDNATADGMKQTLILNGSGQAQPTEAEQQEMLKWNETLYTKIMNP